jgi:hypothetical protein
MKKAFERLDIYVCGDRLHKPKKVELVSKRRSERTLQSKVEIPDHLRVQRHKTRKIRKSIEAAPNAPLLKRMVRNPQALDRAYFVRVDSERLTLDTREKIRFPRIVQEQLNRDKRVKKIQPMKLHLRPTTVTIPSVEEWLEENND